MMMMTAPIDDASASNWYRAANVATISTSASSW